ncbi:MAG: DMT family transporter, partial [Dehalococcoidales bacterium]
MKAYLVLLVGVVSVSFAAIFIRLAEAPPLVIAAYRLTIASLVLILLTYKKTVPSLKRLSGRDSLLLLLSSFFLALHFALWITSLSYTSIASSVILVTCHPAFVAVISYFLWHEVLNRLTIGGMVLAFAGVVLINYGGFDFGSQ